MSALDDDDIDRNYLVYDMQRRLYVRSGIAEVGMKRRWKEHVSASMRSSNLHRNNKLYVSYPSSNCDPANASSEDVKLGNYQQLEQ